MTRGGNRLRGCLTFVWASRENCLALAIGLWLAGYFTADGWEQRRAFKWLLPFVLLNGDLLVKTFRESRWLWAATALLAYQMLSRLWSSGSEPVANGMDTAMVFLLLVSLVTIGRKEEAARVVLAGLTILCGGVMLYSLFAFYGHSDYKLTVDRLRNVLIYEDGLNPVLTGMLCAFSAVAAASFSCRDGRRPEHYAWLSLLAILVFALMAAESRGAMLAGGAGVIVLFHYGRRKLVPALLTVALGVAAWFGTVFALQGDGDLIERGSTGRMMIYEWFLERVTLLECVIGRGMAANVTIPEEELGWFVDHPHSSYLTQFLLTGAVGLVLQLALLGWAGWSGIRESFRGNALWLGLLGCGSVALIFDCGQMFSLYSAPRIEFLLAVVPAAILIGVALERDR